MASCKKRVYRTMCEQPDGSRSGRYKKNRYESVPIDAPKTASGTKKASKPTKDTKKGAKPVRKPVIDYVDDYDRHLDLLDAQNIAIPENKLNRGRMQQDDLMIQKMYLQDAFAKRQASKRKKYTTNKESYDAVMDVINDYGKKFDPKKTLDQAERRVMAEHPKDAYSRMRKKKRKIASAKAKTLARQNPSYASTKPLRYGAWDSEQSKVIDSLPYISDEWVTVNLSSPRFKMPAGKDVRSMGKSVGFKKWSWWYYPKGHSRLWITIEYNGNRRYWYASIGGQTKASTPYDAISIQTSEKASLSSIINQVDKWIASVDRKLTPEQKSKWIDRR